jgi:hypothetical protein
VSLCYILGDQENAIVHQLDLEAKLVLDTPLDCIVLAHIKGYTKSIFSGSSLQMRLSVDISAEIQGWEKNMMAVN